MVVCLGEVLEWLPEMDLEDYGYGIALLLAPRSVACCHCNKWCSQLGLLHHDGLELPGQPSSAELLVLDVWLQQRGKRVVKSLGQGYPIKPQCSFSSFVQTTAPSITPTKAPITTPTVQIASGGGEAEKGPRALAYWSLRKTP